MRQWILCTFVVCACILSTVQGYSKLPITNINNKYIHSSIIHRKQSKLHDLSSDFGVFLYDTQLTLSHTLEQSLSTPSPGSILLLYIAGLITALSPCALSLVPLTVASLTSDVNERTTSVNTIEYASSGSINSKAAALYALGLASVLSIAGVTAAYIGSVVSDKGGIINDLPALTAAALSITMGLNLLSIINIQFPSISIGNSIKTNQISRELKAFLLGASSALVASPCSSPVLTSLLAFIASSGNPLLGLVFLFSYSIGYATPIVFAGNLSNIFTRLSNNFQIANTIVASLLITYGTYSSLDIFTRLTS